MDQNIKWDETIRIVKGDNGWILKWTSNNPYSTGDDRIEVFTDKATMMARLDELTD